MAKGFKAGVAAVSCIAIFFAYFNSPFAMASPQRIVTLSPVVAEWVAEILGEKETLKRVVGASEYSQYPNYLSKIKTIGPYPQLHIEEIVNLNPDLVIAVEATTRPEQIEKLKRLNLRVVVLKKESFEGMGDWITDLGKALEEDKLAKNVRDRWEFEVRALEPKEKSLKVFIEIQSRPLVTVGGTSFITAALKKIGLKNVFEDLQQDYPKVSREAVMKADPDQIWILDLSGDRAEFEKSEKEWERLKSMRAVKDDKVKIVKGDDFARCSMRLLKALKSIN